MSVISLIKALKSIFSNLYSRRKGLDKPIFLVASLTLAIMFLLVYYTATTGWIEGLGGQFNDMANGFSSDIQ